MHLHTHTLYTKSKPGAYRKTTIITYTARDTYMEESGKGRESRDWRNPMF